MLYFQSSDTTQQFESICCVDNGFRELSYTKFGRIFNALYPLLTWKPHTAC